MSNQKLKFILFIAIAPALLFAQKREWPQLEEIREDYSIDVNRPFRLNVDVDAGKVRVEKANKSDQIGVHLAYTKGEFRHFLRYNESRNELEVILDKESWFEHDGDRMVGELTIELPDGGELELAFSLKAGEVDMKLGGLRISDFALKTMAGEVEIDFDEPNKIEMNYLDLNTKIGESVFRHLGNARFGNADINGGIGEMTVDFRGELAADATARIDLDIGETVIILPQETGTRLSLSQFPLLSEVNLPFDFSKEGHYYYSNNYDRAEKRLQLKVSSGLGELRFED